MSKAPYFLITKSSIISCLRLAAVFIRDVAKQHGVFFMTSCLWNSSFFGDCKLRIRRCPMLTRGRLSKFKSLTSDKLLSHWKLLTPAAWKSRVTKLASVAFSADHICPTQTLPTELITGSGSRAQDIAAALQRFPIETNRQWKHVFSALPSASRIDIEMVLTTVF